MVKRTQALRHPPRKIDLRDTMLHSKERRMLKSIINETNFLEMSFREIFGKDIDRKDFRDVTFSFYNQGAYRIAYLVEMNVRKYGQAEMICKISHENWNHHVEHQILGKIVDPRSDLAPITAGLWQMSNGKALLTEEMIRGATFDSFIGAFPSKTEENKIVTLLCRTCFLFWKDFHHIFIKDPHRQQFVIVERKKGPGISIIDTGSVNTTGDITWKIPNDGSIILKNEKGETVPQLSWVQKTSPKDFISNLIFYLEKPDEQLGADFDDLNTPYVPAYNLPRLILFNSIIYALGRKDGTAFLREVKGIDKELDKLAQQKGAY